MSVSDPDRTSIVRSFGGRRRILRLRIGEIEELELLCAAGIGQIYMRLIGGAWKLADIRDTLRLGLVGGGMPRGEADALIEREIDPNPLMDHLQKAVDLLTAVNVGAQAAAEETGGADDPKAHGSVDPATSPVSSPPGSSRASDLPT